MRMLQLGNDLCLALEALAEGFILANSRRVAVSMPLLAASGDPGTVNGSHAATAYLFVSFIPPNLLHGYSW